MLNILCSSPGETDTEKEDAATPKPGSGDDGKKKKRRIRLDMHLDQIFLDSQDAFVWLYDPVAW